MSEAMEKDAVVDALFSHVFRDGAADDELIYHGRFPPNWTTKYRELLATASDHWVNEPLWPRKLVASIHFASWYLNSRYDVWLKSDRSQSQRCEQTERELASLRSPSEIFLMHGSTP
jgi:hypothetical protein